jgi:predicted acyl esterase
MGEERHSTLGKFGWISLFRSGKVYEVDVEIWPTSIVYPRGYTMALTIGGKDFERTGATGTMRGSGIFMHDSAADRPAPEFAGTNTMHTGGEQASRLLLPRIPQK